MGRKMAPALPQCEGPKLHSYNPLGTAEIEFLEKIGSGVHSHVAKVRIDGKTFALKIFMNQIIDKSWLWTFPEYEHLVDLERLELESHPFHAECRAYARLKEAHMEHLAIKCHGYLNLTDAQEEAAMVTCGERTWWNDYFYDGEIDGTDGYMHENHPRYYQKPRRAIVKDFIEADFDLTTEVAETMREDLYGLHSCGITVNDLKTDAYVAGSLADFSKALTIPNQYYELGFNGLNGGPDAAAKQCVYRDLCNLEGVFEEWNEAHPDGDQITLTALPDLSNETKTILKTLPDCTDDDKLKRLGIIECELRKRCFNPRTVNWRKYRYELRSGEVRAVKPISMEQHGSKEDRKNSPRSSGTELQGKDTLKPSKMVDSSRAGFFISLQKYLPWLYPQN